MSELIFLKVSDEVSELTFLTVSDEVRKLTKNVSGQWSDIYNIHIYEHYQNIEAHPVYLAPF